MRLRIGGLSIALLIVLPVLALPLLAMLGVPHLAPILRLFNLQAVDRTANNPPIEPSDDLLAPFPVDELRQSRGNQQADLGAPQRSNSEFLDDPFHQIDDDIGHASALGNSQRYPSLPPQATNGWERLPGQGVINANLEQPANTASPRNSANGGQAGQFRNSSDPNRDAVFGRQGPTNSQANVAFNSNSPSQPQPAASNPRLDQPLTWKSATARLNQLGVRRFLLQPAERENEFHFSCYFTPVDNPRITHKFEADASEPLRAVQKVLDQIENWLDNREQFQSNHAR